MSLSPKNLADGALTASLVTQYTAPANTKAIIKAASLCNTSGGAVLVTLTLNPRTAGSARTLIDNRSVADEETYNCPEVINHVLEAGGVIQASGLNVLFVMSGVEIV